MAKKRIPIPKEIAAKVLFDSDRTCCVCRKERQRIQIHHIDEDPSNNIYENLAVLCFDCHWETQIRGGFDRKLDSEQIQLYKLDWVTKVNRKKFDIKQAWQQLPIQKADEKSYIEYEVIQDSVVSYSNTMVLKSSGYFVVTTIAFILFWVSAAGIGFYFKEPLLIFVALPVCLVGGFYLNKYWLFIKMLFLPQSDEIDRYINGKYVHKGSDGNYTTYEKLAKCNFPRCDGDVGVYTAPPREKYKYGIIGRCNVEPSLHTFTVDFNGIGYFKEMDFRALPQQTK